MRYEDYYGFAESPFTLTSDPRYHFASAGQTNAFQSIEYAVRRRDRLIAMTGDSGTGKTTLCRMLPERLGREVVTVFVSHPVASEEELLRALLQGFGIISRASAGHARLASVGREALTHTLCAFLKSLGSVGACALAIIDDAETAAPCVLEALARLSSAEGSDPDVLQVLLVAESSLREALRRPEFRRVDQRVSMRHELKPLSRQETAAYITHRVAKAGGAATVSFSAGAVARVFGCTRGVPRLVNLLCDRALVAACAAQATRVLSGHVDRAAEALDLARPGRLLLAWAR